MHNTSLLLIDDDSDLARLLEDYLGNLGYTLTHAIDGRHGLTLSHQREFDVILLDVMMPVMDGFEVLKQLRRSHFTPVIMLTARGDDIDRILGLELGADDYIPKPFNPRELGARINALVRRVQHQQSTATSGKLTLDAIELDTLTHQVTVNQQPVSMTGTEFAILHALLLRPGQIITKHQLSEQALGRKLAPFDRSIDMHISNLRKKLSLCCAEERIKAQRGQGYMILGHSHD